VIEENSGRGHAAPTPNELGKGQEEEDCLFLVEPFLSTAICSFKRSCKFMRVS
jgi:hypothetical protein